MLTDKVNIIMSLQAIYHYKIAAAFPVGQEISFEDLSRRCSLDLSQLKSVLRMATSNNIFVESRKGVLAHTAISKLLAEDPLVHEWTGLVCDEMMPSAGKAVQAMLRWPASQEPHETGFALAHGDSLWNVLKKEPHRAQRFAAGMQFLQSHPAFDIEHLIRGLAWDANAAPTSLVDIGGSRGYISMGLLRRYPQLKCHVQDVPEALHGVQIPADLQGRLEFSAHDFFTEQMIKGAEVYFLRSILHDWSDKYAVEIIRNIIPALKTGARVIVNEVCLPEPNTVPAYHEQLLRYVLEAGKGMSTSNTTRGYHLAMLHQFNSQERDAAEWEALFRKADGRFKLGRIVSLPGSILSIMEFVWLGDVLPADGSTA
jgi:hypothetical protein